MALNCAKVQLFNYICGTGDDAKDALASELTKLEVKNWLETHADRLVVLFKDQNGKPIGGRINLRRKICLQYVDTGLCQPPKGYCNCALWHICKRFIEGDCDGKCGRSHDFHDKDNRTNTTEAGLENFPSQLIRNIVAYSLPQICLLYSRSECKARACPYLHVCPSVIRKTYCECCMSHNLLDQHNEKVLERYKLNLLLKSKLPLDFVLCNILYPVEQRRVCKSSKDSYQACRKEAILTSKLPVASHHPHLRNVKGKAPKMSGNIMTGSKDLKDVQVQNRSLSDSSTEANVGAPCFRDDRKPHHWSSTASGTNYTRVKVEPDSSEFKEVETLFRKTMTGDKIIDGVERVENPFLWETYCRKKDHMVALAMQNDPQSMASGIMPNCEKRLFHGTSPEAVESISKKNFDWRVCGKNGTKYGEGSYFATNASYSHSYTRSDSDGSRFMFLARVLIGSYTKGRPDYRRPPLKDPSDPASDLYDSCVDNECNPKIFIIFDSDQFYPEHIIKYLTLEQNIITANSWGFYTSPNINGTGSNLKKPAAAPRPSENYNTNPWSPRRSLRANRARFYSASNLQQPQVAAPRSAHYHKANPRNSSTSQSPTLAMSHSGLNVQQRSVQNYKANPWSPSTRLSANRALSFSDLNLKQPVAAPRNAQDYKANPWCPSTSLSDKRAPSYSDLNLQLPVAAQRRAQNYRANPWSASTSLSAKRALSYSDINLQQPEAAPRNAQDHKANPWSPSTSLSPTLATSNSDLNFQLPVETQRRAQNYKANPWSASTSLSAKRTPSYSASNLQQPITTPVRSHGNAADLRTPSTSLRASNRSLFSHSVSNLQQTTKASGSSQGDAANSTKSSGNYTASRSNASKSKKCLIL